ncbi:tetratricopeptide repeat protein [Thermodesulfobacteriota bacterium]
MMRQTFLSAILILAVAASAGPVEAAESGVGLYNLGNRHYSVERYDEAVEAYLGALETGIENAALLYNLGNATLKMGRLGEAILYYERGIELDPKDEDLRFNLEFAKSLVKGTLKMPKKGALWRFFKWLYSLMGLNSVVLLLSALLFLFCACILIRIYTSTLRLRTPLVTIQSICVALFILCGILLYAKVHYEVLVECGVLLAERVEARSGPGATHTPIFPLHEGMTFEIHGRRTGWMQIRLPNGLTGWIRTETMEVI